MMKKKVDFITSKTEDWVEIYIDGKRIFNGPVIRWNDVLQMFACYFEAEVTHKISEDVEEINHTPLNGKIRKNVSIYTDGACKGNPGAGGYAAIITYSDAPDIPNHIVGGYRLTTNNRMELMAAIAALKSLKEVCDVTLYTDSSYLSDAFNKKWIYKWRSANWQRGDVPVTNKDLWIKLWDLCSIHKVTFVWIKGHKGDELNEKCDKLSVAESQQSGLPKDSGYEE
jgi:ribonuclease HI